MIILKYDTYDSTPVLVQYDTHTVSYYISPYRMMIQVRIIATVRMMEELHNNGNNGFLTQH